MRILANTLFTVPGVQTGAVRTVTEALLFQLAQESALRGHEFVLLVSDTNQTHWRSICPKGKFCLIPARTSNRVYRVAIEQAACAWAARRMKADIFYSSSGALPHIRMPCKSIVYLQNLLFFHFDEFYSRERLGVTQASWLLNWRASSSYSRWAFETAMTRATEIIAVSKTMAAEAVSHSSVRRTGPLHIVPYGINPVFSPDSTMTRPWDGDYLISVSNVVPHKNFEAAISAFASLKRRHNLPHTLIIIGSGPKTYLNDLRRYAAGLNVGSSIVFKGHVPHLELPAWYTHAVAFVLTSACESFGLPVLEAMACGVPVLTSNLSGLPETVGLAGITADPSDSDVFADQMYRLIRDEQLRKSLRHEGFLRASGFTWNRTAIETLAIMEQAVQ